MKSGSKFLFHSLT